VSEIPGFASAPSCFLRPVRLPTAQCTPKVSRDQVEAEMSAYFEVLHRLQATLPNVRFVDSLATLCSPTECSQWPTDGLLLYSDDIHLSPAGGRFLAQKSGLNEAISERIRLARTQ
jgi:SGNH domain (fused to AT3 domains)